MSKEEIQNATQNQPTPLELAITMMLCQHAPKLNGRVRICVRPRAPFLYHAHRLDAGTVIVRTSIRLNSRRELDALTNLARSCVEILESRTTASAVMEH